MWARVCEFMIACWLMMSPFVFRHGAEDRVYWLTDLGASTVVMVLAVISYWDRTKHAHLGIAFVGLVLAAVGRLAVRSPVPPAGQNEILVGLLLLMFAIVPNNAARPASTWIPASETK